MPLISSIGRRSFKVRVIFAAMYVLLIVGSITMIYPLLLMLSGSTKSDTDFSRPTPIPEYFYSDRVLWQKYLESKYALVPGAEIALQRTLGSWRTIAPPLPGDSQ